MAVTTAKSTNPVRARRSMTIARAGNIASNSAVTRDVDYTLLSTLGSRVGGKMLPPLTDSQIGAIGRQANGTFLTLAEPNIGRSRSCTFKPYTAGTFAYQAKNRYVIMAHSDTLSGVANTTVRIPGRLRGSGHPIHRLEVYRTTGLRSWSWGYAAGKEVFEFTPTYTNKNTVNLNATTALRDDAARPTRLIPGEFNYNDGKGKGVSPTLRDYVAKTG